MDGRADVVITREFWQPIKWIKSVRLEVGVPEDNPYVFGEINTLLYVENKDFLNKQKYLCGAEKPHLLGCQAIRRDVATRSAVR